MKVKDSRYQIIQMLLSSGSLKKFTDIFTIIPPSVVAKDLSIHNRTLDKKIKSLDQFTFKEVFRMAELIGWDPSTLINMTIEEIKNPSA